MLTVGRSAGSSVAKKNELQKVPTMRCFELFTSKCACRPAACNFSTAELQKGLRSVAFSSRCLLKAASLHAWRYGPVTTGKLQVD